MMLDPDKYPPLNLPAADLRLRAAGPNMEKL